MPNGTGSGRPATLSAKGVGRYNLLNLLVQYEFIELSRSNGPGQTIRLLYRVQRESRRAHSPPYVKRKCWAPLQPATIKKEAACLLFCNAIIWTVSFTICCSTLCVCVLVYFKEKPRPNIYIAPPVLYVYISSPSCAAPGCSGLLRLSMQPKSSLLLLGQERQVAVVYFDPFW